MIAKQPHLIATTVRQRTSEMAHEARDLEVQVQCK